MLYCIAKAFGLGYSKVDFQHGWTQDIGTPEYSMFCFERRDENTTVYANGMLSKPSMRLPRIYKGPTGHKYTLP